MEAAACICVGYYVPGISFIIFSPAFSRLCEELHSLTNLTLLAAARTHNYKPEHVLQRSLSDSHRLSRPVLQEMIEADFVRTPGHISTVQSTRSQTKATSADHIRQLDHEGSGHTAKEPKDGQLCGERVSKVLDEWNVGEYSDIFCMPVCLVRLRGRFVR